MSDGIPEWSLCPITLEMMKDPIIAADGLTYEREAIEDWIYNYKKDTSPSTGEKLAHLNLIKNFRLKEAIQASQDEQAKAKKKREEEKNKRDEDQMFQALLESAKKEVSCLEVSLDFIYKFMSSFQKPEFQSHKIRRKNQAITARDDLVKALNVVAELHNLIENLTQSLNVAKSDGKLDSVSECLHKLQNHLNVCNKVLAVLNNSLNICSERLNFGERIILSFRYLIDEISKAARCTVAYDHEKAKPSILKMRDYFERTITKKNKFKLQANQNELILQSNNWNHVETRSKFWSQTCSSFARKFESLMFLPDKSECILF